MEIYVAVILILAFIPCVLPCSCPGKMSLEMISERSKFFAFVNVTEKTRPTGLHANDHVYGYDYSAKIIEVYKTQTNIIKKSDIIQLKDVGVGKDIYGCNLFLIVGHQYLIAHPQDPGAGRMLKLGACSFTEDIDSQEQLNSLIEEIVEDED